MSKNQDRVLLRKLLDLSEGLGELRRRQRGDPPEDAGTLRFDAERRKGALDDSDEFFEQL